MMYNDKGPPGAFPDAEPGPLDRLTVDEINHWDAVRKQRRENLLEAEYKGNHTVFQQAVDFANRGKLRGE